MNAGSDNSNHACGACNKCTCIHHKLPMIAVLLIGVSALLGAWNVLSPMIVANVWPILLIIAAGTKIMGRKCKCC